MSIDIWIIHAERKILVTDFPGPPAAICGFVSEEARAAAAQRGYATVSEIGFPSDCHLGADDWEEALRLAEQKAQEFGYRVKQEDRFWGVEGSDEGGEEWETDEEERERMEEWEPEPDYPEGED